MNIMITNFPFLPVAVLLFIFPPIKPRTSRHPNQIYVNKRNSFMVQKSHISFCSFYWSLFLPITMELFCFFFFVNCAHFIFSTLFLTDSLEKCQTKNFENEYYTCCNLQILYPQSTPQRNQAKLKKKR